MTTTPLLRRARAVRSLSLSVALVVAIAVDAFAQLQIVPYVSGLNAPVEFVQDPSSPSVQFVVEQGGLIRVIQNGALLPTPFLDVSGAISVGGERGLLGLAFAPDYETSRRFFINFTDPNGNTVVARFKRSVDNALVADPATRFDLRWGGGQPFIEQPFANHNGGHLAFGPDYMLYVALGDGGDGGDPLNTAQRPDTLLGKLLRINVLVDDDDPEGYDVPGDNPFVGGVPIAALHEIWAFGLRNPWKFSFDEVALGGTGAMLIGDVGQGLYEEVNYQPPGIGGRNYGWRVREGAHPYIQSPGPAYLPLVDPIVEYDHSVGHSITGGVVYRGYSLGAAYRGRYFYADFVNARVWSIALIPAEGWEVTVSAPTEHTAELGGSAALGNISAFGVDAVGELYIVSYSSGQILRVVTPTVYRPLDPSDIDGDGKADAVVWRPSTGAWLGTRSSDGGSLNRLWGAGYAPYNDLPVPGDYDGDGKTDIAVWRPSSGMWYVRQSTDDTIQARQWGGGFPPFNDVPVPGDYDGDGITDVAVWRPTDGIWYIRRSSNGTMVSGAWGGGFLPYNDTPVPADYDGDGKTDIAIWRPSDGFWWVFRSSDGGTYGFQWGGGDAPYFDVPVVGDYDGDGRADIAIWRRPEGVWYVYQSATGTLLSVQWGGGFAPYNDIAVPGDYDGDGRTDIAVWRPGAGARYVRRSSDGTFLQLQLGAPGDVP